MRHAPRWRRCDGCGLLALAPILIDACDHCGGLIMPPGGGARMRPDRIAASTVIVVPATWAPRIGNERVVTRPEIWPGPATLTASEDAAARRMLATVFPDGEVR